MQEVNNIHQDQLRNMKKILLYTWMLVVGATSLTSCSEDDLSPVSVITSPQTSQNDFDKWLEKNFVLPYNIDFKYRLDDNELDMNYYQVPASYESAIIMAHVLKYACVEVYNEVAGIEFTRRYFPKMFVLSGEWEYRNNGTYILGTAEGGKKIFLAGADYLPSVIRGEAGYRQFSFVSSDPLTNMNYYFFKTIHHEFTHILNQTKNYSEDFQLITGSLYVADSWSEAPNNVDYLKRGFISSYAQHSHQEDFAEMLSLYVTSDEAQWQQWMTEAGTSGAQLLEDKLEIVRDYMQNEWNVDIDQLRSSILSREEDVINGDVDLLDLSL